MNFRYIFLIVMITAFYPVSRLSAYTWFLEGEWKYVYTADKNSATEFENSSNSQKIKRVNGNRAVMMHKAIIKRQPSRIKYPIMAVKENEAYIRSSYISPDDLKFMKDFSAQIIGDAKYLDEAVERVALWVRNNITYQLGSPSDAIGVIKAKRAYCVGYGDVAVELLRAAGIPARTLTCYIPPNCGWGGNYGGYHAYIEYYIPGRGWVCTDPQATLNFADPFHLVDAGFSSQNSIFSSEIKQIDETYVTDFQDEPLSWGVYTAEARGEQKYPAFIFNVRNTSGGFLKNPGVSFKNIPEKYSGGGTTYYGGQGMSMRFDGSGKVHVVTSSEARYFSIIFTDPVLKDKKHTETVSFQFDSCLYLEKINFAGAKRYFIKADFYQGENMRGIWLRNEKDEVMANVPVSVNLGGESFELKTDSKGLIYIITNEKEGTFTVSEKSYTIPLNGSKNVRLFPFEKKQDRDDYLKRNRLDASVKPILLLELYDLTGTFSGKSFENVTIFKKGGKIEKLSKSQEGFAHYEQLSPGEEYTVICSYGNFYIKKKFISPQSGVLSLKIKPTEEIYSTLEADDYEGSVPSYFESIPGTGSLEYKTSGKRIYLSFPDGKYLFGDNSDLKNLVLLNLSKKSESFIYRPELNSAADYKEIASVLYSGERFISGSLKSGENKISEEPIFFYNSKTSKLTKGYIDRNGFFSFAQSDPGENDFLIYSGNNYLVLKHVSSMEERFISIDTALLTKKEFRTFEKTGSSYYSSLRETGLIITLLFPQIKNGLPEPVRFDLQNSSGKFTMYVDKGNYFFAVNRDYNNVYLVTSADKKTEYGYPSVEGDKRDEFSDRVAFLKASADRTSPFTMLELKDRDGKAIVSGRILFNDGTTSMEYRTGDNGIVVIPGLKPGVKYRILYSAKGVYMEYPFSCGNERVNPVRLSLKEMKSFALNLKNYDGNIYSSVPCRDKLGLLFFDNRVVVPDDGNGVKVYSGGDEVYFRLGKENILKSFTSSKNRYTVDYKELNNSADEEYRKIVKNLFRGETALVVSFFSGNKILNSSRFKLTTDTEKVFATGRDGVVVIYPAPAGEVKISYSDNGYFAEKTITVKEKETSFFYYDREKNRNLSINFDR